VGEGGDGRSSNGDEELLLGRKVRAGGVGEQRGGGDADEGVEGVPDEVEAGDFVGQELAGEEEGADGDDPGVGEGAEFAGEDDPVQARHDAERANGGVDVEARGKADGDDQRGESGGRDGKSGHEEKANIWLMGRLGKEGQ